MKPHEKFYTSRDPLDEELILISEVLTKIDLTGVLKNGFIYILMRKQGDFEILSFENEYVFLASKELQVNNKMAIEYLIEKPEIDQEINQVLFDNNIGGFKKFKAVKKEKITRKGVVRLYHDFDVYEGSVQEAEKILLDIGFKDYLYLQDVSKEK